MTVYAVIIQLQIREKLCDVYPIINIALYKLITVSLFMVWKLYLYISWSVRTSEIKIYIYMQSESTTHGYPSLSRIETLLTSRLV